MLLTLDLNGPAPRARGNGENLVDEEGATVTSVFTFQPSSAYSSEFDAPQTDCFSADCDTALC
jgi:hypothetical protein